MGNLRTILGKNRNQHWDFELILTVQSGHDQYDMQSSTLNKVLGLPGMRDIDIPLVFSRESFSGWIVQKTEEPNLSAPKG